MKKENCNISLKWDYKGWEKLVNGVNPYTQDDWNQTLSTMINQASAHIHQVTLRGPADSVRMNIKTFYVITRLEYFNEFTFKIADRYNVVIDNELLDDEIFVYNYEMLTNPGDYFVTYEKGETKEGEDGIETEILNIDYRRDFTGEELVEFKKKLCVHIQILNRKPTI